MSKSAFLSQSFLELVFNGTAEAGLFQNAATGAKTKYYIALHSSDPGEAGNMSSNEVAYGAYSRQSLVRNATNFPVATDATADYKVNLGTAVDFPQATSGTVTATHFSVGTDTGASQILYSGTITPNISISTGVTPRLTTGTKITED